MARQTYNLHLKGYVGGWDFDADYVDFVLGKNADSDVHVLIDSLGGSLASALSISSAFRNHGRVNVPFVGMNASAATIASLGASHISMDASAMYLVHKCSMEFIQWATANSDKLTSIIKEAKQMKDDLDKMDANVAEMYAGKCKRKPEDLLALMKKGGWLTAKEALDWGFVDEITEYEDDAAPVITDKIAAHLTAAGIPIPSGITKDQSSNGVMTRFIEALTNLFKSNFNHRDLMKTNSTPAQEQILSPEAESHTEEQALALAQKDQEIAALKAEIEQLKKGPGDSTSQIVNNSSNNQKYEQSSAAEEFYRTRQRAKALYDMLPH